MTTDVAHPDAASARPPRTPEQVLSHVVIRLLRGVVYQQSTPDLWRDLNLVHAAVADHLAVMGLDVVVDESEGYAYVRSKPPTGEGDDVPRLVPRRRLSFHVSLLLALLRKRLAELDARAGDTRLVLSRDQIVEMLRIYLPDRGSEARLVQQIDVHIRKVLDLGFLARSGGNNREFEVRRILKAYVDGQWLADFDERLHDYLTDLRAGEESPLIDTDDLDDEAEANTPAASSLRPPVPPAPAPCDTHDADADPIESRR